MNSIEIYQTKRSLLTFLEKWNKIFVDPRLTAALVDRVIHHAYILSFTGDSYRLKHALSNR